MADELVRYAYTERYVDALPMSAENAAVLIDTVKEPTIKGEFKSLTLAFDENTASYRISFQYFSESVPNVLTEGNFLVKNELTTKLSVMDAVKFGQSYEPYSTAALSDGAILPE